MTNSSPSGSHQIPAKPPGYARTAVGGVAWQGLSFLLGKILVFLTTVILAHLLTPRDFGVVGLALVFIVYAEALTDLGVAQALVFLTPDQRRNNAALVISVLFSGALTTAAIATAPIIAEFFDRPATTTMIRCLALALLIRGFGQVPDGLLRKNLLFRRRVFANVSRALFQGVISVLLALAGLGAWAIVWGYLAGETVWCAAIWKMSPYRPSGDFWRLTSSATRSLLAYGTPAAANALIFTLVSDIDYLIIGRQLGTEALGYYTLGFRIPQFLIINVFYVLSTVAFPVYSRVREDPHRLQRAYLTSQRLQTTYGVGVGIAVAVLAPMLVHVLLSPKWNPSIPVLQALALYAAFRSLGSGTVDVYRGLGKPSLAMWTALIRLIVLVPSLLFSIRFGIVGVAWTQAIVAFLGAVLLQWLACRILGLSGRRLAAAMLPALAVAVGTAGGAGAVRLWLPGSEALRLGVGALAGGVGGIAIIHVVDRRFLREVWVLLRRRARSAEID